MNTRLVVNDFSCIVEADLEVSTLTVLIGPSASGKSIISKLIFFFNDLLNEQWQTIEEGKGLDAFKDLVKIKFKEWFPVEAWGNKKFQIEFYSGDYQVRISRVEYRKKLGENMRIWFSPFFEEQYGYALSSMRDSLKASDQGQMDHRYMMVRYGLQDNLRKIARKRLEGNYVDVQTFIPAGRSFFTSIGKSIAAFEHNKMLDPLILRFGRFFAATRERGFRFSSARSATPFTARLESLMSGALVFERNREYLRTEDGRKVPFSSMSSGQQELMPLVLALKRRAEFWRDHGDREMLYIEEPEAHLFPAAQSSLVEIFVLFLAQSQGRAKMLLTTHSPYVLAKLNNLIKAKEVAGRRRGTKKHAMVQEIIKEDYWFDGEKLNAYAIKNGRLQKIQDEEDNLIEAEYLDEVSNSISIEFSRLLEVEYLR